MEGDFIKINKWLLPLSWLYGMAVNLRNTMFSIGLLKTRSFDVPVIAVGNITVGGSGKTPHVEYLIRLLKDTFHTAVLSRGYKRKSKGFVQAKATSTMPEIGDEPFQMKQKYPDVIVAVDKNRCHGIDTLVENDKDIDVILLDDAFQHRYVKPGINILLVDYHRLIIYDTLLPAGRLREPLSGKDRADIVIVTKCPKDLKHHALLLTGIASPQQMTHDLEPLIPQLTPLAFGDHHVFTPKDVELINSTYATLPSPKLIITTEKDVTRLRLVDGLSEEVRQHLYALPITVCFLQEQTQLFNQQIIDYVHKNSRNSILVKRKDDHKPHDSNHSGDRPRTISFRDN